jgi:hypothetical protein
MYLSIDSNAKWWKIENTPLKYTYRRTEINNQAEWVLINLARRIPLG